MNERSDKHTPAYPIKPEPKHKPTDKVTDKHTSVSLKIGPTCNAGGINKSKVHQVPDTNFILATLVCLCFNLPIGGVAMYLSLTAAKAYRDGKTEKGDFRVYVSVLLSLFSIVSTVLIVMAIVLLMVIENQSKRDDT